jgi:hypothetical protein
VYVDAPPPHDYGQPLRQGSKVAAIADLLKTMSS